LIDSTVPILKYLIAGRITRDYIIFPDGYFTEDVLGGNALYAGVGLRLWDSNIGLVSKVGEDYPQAWLEKTKKSFDIRGVKVVPDSFDTRVFRAYQDAENYSEADPMAHYAGINTPYPKTLLGYQNPVFNLDSRTQPNHHTIRLTDIPSDYFDVTAAHLCPLDYLSHSLLSGTLKQGQTTTITLEPSPGYMDPIFWDDIPAIINGLSAFIPFENNLCNLFVGRTTDLWEMAETIASWGCEYVVIQRGQRGFLLYDHSRRKKYIVPVYQTEIKNVHGFSDAFCGGFLAGLHQTYDPVEAALYGSISASFVGDGYDAFYALDCMESLLRARLDALRSRVVEV